MKFVQLIDYESLNKPKYDFLAVGTGSVVLEETPSKGSLVLFSMDA